MYRHLATFSGVMILLLISAGIETAYSQVTNSTSMTSIGYYHIPPWIKNNAQWWATGQIGDDDFLKGIQYLINQNIIILPSVQQASSAQKAIPIWIKNDALWWATGKIGDDDFVKGMQFLVANQIIQVSSTSIYQQSTNSTKFPLSLVFPDYIGSSLLSTLQPKLIAGDVVLYYSNNPVKDDSKYKNGFFAPGVKFYAVYASKTGIADIENASANAPAGYDIIYDDYEDCGKTNGKCDKAFTESQSETQAIFARGIAATQAYNTRTGGHAFFWASPSGAIAGAGWDWSSIEQTMPSPPNLLSLQTQSQQETSQATGVAWAQSVAKTYPQFYVQTSLAGSHTPSGVISYAWAFANAHIPQISGIVIFGHQGLDNVLNALR